MGLTSCRRCKASAQDIPNAVCLSCSEPAKRTDFSSFSRNTFCCDSGSSAPSTRISFCLVKTSKSLFPLNLCKRNKIPNFAHSAEHVQRGFHHAFFYFFASKKLYNDKESVEICGPRMMRFVRMDFNPTDTC